MIRARRRVHGISTAMMLAAHPTLETTLTRAGLDLHVEHFAARSPARLALVMVHGFSAHCALYRHVGATLAERGIAFTAFDCRGHGRSGGRRGHVDDFGDYLDDLDTVVAWARAHAPGVPWALLGHSLGGAVAIAFTQDDSRIDKPIALVAATPWLKLKMKVPVHKRMAGPIAARVYPTLTMANGLRAADVSRNPLVLANFDQDPLVHHVASAGWFFTTLRAQARIRARAERLRVPTLILLAEQDRIVANEATRTFADAAGAGAEVRSYPALFHEVFLEPEADTVIDDVGSWLLQRLESKTA
jgi:alpha-beta hydrolase superfamily lysophospholipase